MLFGQKLAAIVTYNTKKLQQNMWCSMCICMLVEHHQYFIITVIFNKQIMYSCIVRKNDNYINNDIIFLKVVSLHSS